ncbi:MAG: spore maturation protein [Clostridia bacterium]|nr:spore maturation protein [Clostridia bacterium]
MPVFSLIVPLLFMGVFLYAAFKKVKIYDGFVKGVKGAIPLIIDLFPYLAAMFMLTELFEKSGLSALLCSFLAPAFEFVGVPQEIIKLVLIKPFSGSGATALLTEILETYPPDGYIARCAAVCYGTSETVFYIGAVYFSRVKNARLAPAIAISLIANFVGVILGCFLCRLSV